MYVSQVDDSLPKITTMIISHVPLTELKVSFSQYFLLFLLWYIQ